MSGAPPELRGTLVNVYLKAVKEREASKATKNQLKSAKSALFHLGQALESLERVSTDVTGGRTGLHTLLEGPPLEDKKGEQELNEFASACWKVRLDIANPSMALQSAINTEEKKQSKAGERPRRLRTLVDALADWWHGTGGSLAPIVDANRRDDAPAVVHGRRGRFLDLAVALFCNVDTFKESEVVAAVTNVHEKRLRQPR